jgi:hypothetical protein
LRKRVDITYMGLVRIAQSTDWTILEIIGCKALMSLLWKAGLNQIGMILEMSWKESASKKAAKSI